MFNKVALAVLLCALQGSLALVTEQYCWKEYRGEIPEDAVPGGKSINGDEIYIGQVLYQDKLLPAKIYRNDPKAYFAFNTEQSTTNNIKILCSEKPERFKWIPVSKDGVHMLTDVHLISGGTEPNYVDYIGRAMYKSETLVGRVRTGDKSTFNTGLQLTSGGKVTNVDTFEILSYEPEADTTEIRHCNKRVVIVRN